FGVGVVQGGTLMASDSGSGTASQIGKFTFSIVKIADLAKLTGSGGFVMALPNGDKMYGEILGAGDPSNPAHEIITLTIAGGTGRFQGATGSLTFDRMIDFSTLPAFESNYGTVNGTISTPRRQ